MKKFALALVVLISSASVSNAAQPPQSFADLVDKLSPAVVNISTTQVVKGYDLKQFQGGSPFPPGSPFEEFNQMFNDPMLQEQAEKPRKATSLGSGFIIDPSGLVVTNNHVVAGGSDITVTLNNDVKYKAKIIGRDTKVDIALLKINSDKPLPFVKFGNSDTMRVGDWIIAIGNPYGLGGTVTAGIISARARDINVGPFDDFLQTDAAINRGNSGGPMFNVDGEVVGVNTAIFSPSGGNVGIGFATPSALVKPVIEQIQKYGRAKRSWLGVKIQTVTDEIADSLGLKTTGGALVLEVLPNSPAAKADIKEGDVIMKFNNQQVAAMRRLPRIVADTEIGSVAPMEVYRDGKTITVNVTLTEMVEDKKDQAKTSKEEVGKNTTAVEGKVLLGMKLVEITPQIKKQYKIAASSGLLIAEVSGSSDARDNGIRSGNVITKANQKSIATIADLEAVIVNARKQGRKAVLLMVEAGNGAESSFVPVELK